MLQPSHFAHQTGELRRFIKDAGITCGSDPLSTAMDTKRKVRKDLSDVKEQTDADSPIDEALVQRAGVCHDFAHILIACCRSLGIPARYVSGYVYTGDRPAP
jgi:transglutaminase-like putative cysteine protease